jgi:hypothetical protein
MLSHRAGSHAHLSAHLLLAALFHVSFWTENLNYHDDSAELAVVLMMVGFYGLHLFLHDRSEHRLINWHLTVPSVHSKDRTPMHARSHEAGEVQIGSMVVAPRELVEVAL